ncbi:MAG: helix-turn-helix domain-containing protein, partial [Actinomycetota bacterium]
MTPSEIIYHRRLRVLDHAAKGGNIAESCRVFGISRPTFYRWQQRAQAYGLEALMPKQRRRPQLPNATPTWMVEELLALAVALPTLGCRQLADRLGDRGYAIGKTTVQKILHDHDLGLRRQRIAKTAALAALVGGIVTEAARDDALWGFCHFAANPGDLVALDSFYIGNLKGVGKVYQLTAVDTATRWALVLLVLGTPTGEVAARFLLHARRRLARMGIRMRDVLSDNGPEWVSASFKAGREALGIAHHRIPPRSPNHNAVCERFQGTALQECWRPAFHRRRFTSLGQLQAEADAWLVHYNTRRRNHSDFMRG